MRQVRKAFVGGVVVALVGAAGVGAAVVGSGPARAGVLPAGDVTAAPSVDLSSGGAVDRYLRSLGVDRGAVVVQRGPRNYAGPDCPGLEWNCTSAKKVIQVATPGGTNRADCAAKAGRRCVIVQLGDGASGRALQSNDGDNFHARCHQRANESAILPDCVIVQNNPTGGDNHATVEMAVHDNDDPTQFGDADAEIVQTATADGDNHAKIHQRIHLHTNDGTTQTQLGQLSADVSQTAELGDNHAHVDQQIRERADARGSTQHQNATPPGAPGSDGEQCAEGFKADANICVNVDQVTDAGDNRAKWDADIDLDARARSPASTQNQGCSSCGIDGDVDQATVTGRSLSDLDAAERQRARAPSGALQTLVIDPHCCATQLGGTDNRAELDLLASQDALPTAVLTARNVVTCNSPNGICDTMSVIVQNGERSEVELTAPTANYIHNCTENVCDDDPIGEGAIGDGPGGE